ncbi:MAG: phosphate/phosphite/phosphonate ABC transporter substrate-binding protein [Ilumatobacteraceae bacterium]
MNNRAGDGGATAGVANLGMYPFADIRWAQDRFYEALRERLAWLPEALDHAADVYATWTRPDLALGQACGWPVATTLRDRVRVLGTLTVACPEADGHLYRSVIVSRRPAGLADLAGSTAAVNSFDSLSGWISLIAAVHGGGGTWRGPTVHTGAHVESLRALQAGRADVAAIDSVTLWHVQRSMPELVDGLEVAGLGPLIPCLALVTSAGTSEHTVVELREALLDTVLDPLVEPAARAMCVNGFVPLETEDYLTVLALGPA